MADTTPFAIASSLSNAAVTFAIDSIETNDPSFARNEMWIVPGDDADITIRGSRAVMLGTAERPTQTEDSCKCPICHDPLFEALVAPCGHACCVQCINKLLAASAHVLSDNHAWSEDVSQALPRCPVCRTAVHRDGFRKCYALEQAAANLHHNELPVDFHARKKIEIVGATNGLADLRTWKAAFDEQAVNDAINYIWCSLKAEISSSTALLILCSRKASEPQCAPTNMREWREQPMNIEKMAIQKRQDAIMSSILSSADEIARRLAKQGLTLMTFRSLGSDYALVTWPALVPTFAPNKALAPTPAPNKA